MRVCKSATHLTPFANLLRVKLSLDFLKISMIENITHIILFRVRSGTLEISLISELKVAEKSEVCRAALQDSPWGCVVLPDARVGLVCRSVKVLVAASRNLRTEYKETLSVDTDPIQR